MKLVSLYVDGLKTLSATDIRHFGITMCFLGRNNTATETTAVNEPLKGDGKVDLEDLIAVAVALGRSPSSPNWNAKADLNQDNGVDLFDLVEVARNFGAGA